MNIYKSQGNIDKVDINNNYVNNNSILNTINSSISITECNLNNNIV